MRTPSPREDIINEELSELPVDSVNHRVSPLGTKSTPVVQNAEADKQLDSKVNQSSPGDGTKRLETQKINSSNARKPPQTFPALHMITKIYPGPELDCSETYALLLNVLSVTQVI